MDRGARIAMVVPATAALIGLSVLAYTMGNAETIAYGASREIDTWSATRSQPGIDTWMRVRADLHRAQRLSSGDPTVQELLGVLHARRASPQAFFEVALEHFVRALELRPTSPYTWANIAEARYQLGRTDSRFQELLVRAATLGPAEPEVQRTVADLGLAFWDEVSPVTRAAVERAIASGMRRNPVEMLQISQRRGRLEPACRHVEGNQRITDPKWVNLCESRRTT